MWVGMPQVDSEVWAKPLLLVHPLMQEFMLVCLVAFPLCVLYAAASWSVAPRSLTFV